VKTRTPGSTGALSADDLAAIHNVLGSYAQRWDSGDFDAFSELFLPDAIADMAITILRGREQIRHFHESRIGQFRTAGIQRRHLIGSIVVAGGAGAHEALITAYAQVFSTQAGSELVQTLPPTTYEGLLKRTDDGIWRIAHWTARPDKPFGLR